MASITPELMDAFLHELEKQAFVPTAQLGRGGLALGAGLTGAAMGGMYQGGKKYHEARQQGQGVGQALGAGAKGGLTGAAVGGAVGAGAGAASKRVGGAVRDFGGQSLHMWTGAGGKHGLDAFNAGGAHTLKNLEHARDAEKAVGSAVAAGTAKDPRMLGAWRDKVMGRSPINQQRIHELAKGEVASAEKAHGAMERAQDRGLTSIPGAVKAFASHPVDAAKDAWGAMAHGTSTGQKALMIGVPGGLAAYGAVRKPKEGETRTGNVLGGVGQALPMAMPWMPTSLAMSMMPGIPSPGMAVGNALERAGKKVGDVAQRAVSRPGQVQPPQQPGGVA